jgi:hypothetical protein
MNMVNKSMEMKKPKTPIASRQNHKKNSLGMGSIFHETRTPVNTIIDESISMATEMPSTPTE